MVKGVPAQTHMSIPDENFLVTGTGCDPAATVTERNRAHLRSMALSTLQEKKCDTMTENAHTAGNREPRHKLSQFHLSSHPKLQQLRETSPNPTIPVDFALLPRACLRL